MIPIRLTMQAFGPYSEREVIDFTKFYHDKLFLITGNTGSGKTMIFDGICYALFGEASGQDRKCDTFKSHFSSKEIITYVEFEFCHRDKKYIISREPEQVKISKNKEVNHRSTAKIIFDNDMIVGVKNVNCKVREILGIDYPQFKQIVMIAQGEFRKLVSADSKDREAIYRKIFNTISFEYIQNSLKEEALSLDKKIDNLNEKIVGFLDSIQFIKEISYDDLTIEQILKILEDEIVTYKNESSNLLIRKKNLSNEIENQKFTLNKLNELLRFENEFRNINVPALKEESHYLNKVNRTFLIRDKEKILNNLYDSYGNVTKQSNELKQALFNCEKDLDLYKKDFETIDVINSKLEDSKNKIIEIQALESCIDEKVQHEESVSKFKYEIEFLILDRRHVSNKVLDIENEKNKILKFENQNKDIIFKISEVEDKINKLSSLRTFLIKYSKSLNSYDEAVSVYRKTKPIYDKIFASYSEKSIEITRSEEIYLRNQAGILAKNLKENSPCMVCGSTKHPNKAMVLENCVDESSLKELRQQFIDLQDKRNEISDKMINLNNQVSIFENNIKEFYHELKLADSDFDFIEFDIFEINTSLFEKIDLLTDNLKDELNLLNEVNEKISKSRERVSKMDEDLLKLHDEIKVLDEKISKIQSNISLSTLIIDNNNEKLCKYGIVTKKDYTDLLEKLREDCQILINKTESLKNNLKQCEDEIIKLRAKIEIKENDILKFESEIKINKEYFFNSLSENGFVSVEEYKAFKLSEDEFHKRADFLQKKRDEYRFLESTISNLKSQIKINEGESIDGIQKSLNDLNQNFNEIENLEKDFYNKIMLLESAKNNITSISKDIFEIDTYRTNLNELSKISNGNNKYKVSFERYILGIYFKEIIAAANIRFLKLTNGRYLFRHLKDGFDLRIQQGLDVSVFDNYTSSERRINTLSGGESFKASLSLALGLSDVIQRYSGGISIDTLFIDEGFGSLDSDSLQSALDCLLQANSESKLIGIVSHVQELKHFISSKIEVLDSPHGSKIKINV